MESSPSPRSRRTETVVVALAAITVSVVAVTVLALTGGNRTQSETPFGIWELVELNGHPVVGNASIAFALEPDRAHVSNARDGSGFNLHHFRGVGGCNRISGAYGFRGDRLSVVSMFRTAASCGDEVDEEEDDFVSVLRSPKWEVMGDQLSLTGDDGAVALLQELATNPAMGVWALSNIDGATLETTVALTLGRDNLLSGYASCLRGASFPVQVWDKKVPERKK